MISGKTIGARTCMQAQPARIMGCMRARTVSAGVRGVLRRHVVGSAALAARKEHAKCAVPQPAKTHKVCAGSNCRRDSIDSNEFCAVGTVQRCSQQCASTAEHQARTLFSRVRARKVCARRRRLTFVRRHCHIVMEPSACAKTSSVDFAGDACRLSPPSRGRPA